MPAPRILCIEDNRDTAELITEVLEDEGFDVSVIDYEQFALGGGGVHCSCHELRRDPA